jgi:hypothetical protein
VFFSSCVLFYVHCAAVFFWGCKYSYHYQELENTSHLAVAAVESGTGSIELLHHQLMAQTNELKEVKRLHR